jgi:hypothetical protein
MTLGCFWEIVVFDSFPPFGEIVYVRQFSLEPELDKQDQKKRGQKKPRDQNYLDSQFADRGNVIGHIWIFPEEPVPITKDVNHSKYINKKEERSRDAKSRKSCRVDVR